MPTRAGSRSGWRRLGDSGIAKGQGKRLGSADRGFDSRCRCQCQHWRHTVPWHVKFLLLTTWKDKWRPGETGNSCGCCQVGMDAPGNQAENVGSIPTIRTNCREVVTGGTRETRQAAAVETALSSSMILILCFGGSIGSNAPGAGRGARGRMRQSSYVYEILCKQRQDRMPRAHGQRTAIRAGKDDRRGKNRRGTPGWTAPACGREQAATA